MVPERPHRADRADRAERADRGERADRPLTARGVLASALLGTDPPELPIARLVALASLFGISDNAARVALSRMAASGEVVAEAGRYRLTGPLVTRHRRQRHSRAADTEPWDGTWIVAVLAGTRENAAARAADRRLLQQRRLGELREGVWMRPANLRGPHEVALPTAALELTAAVADEPVALAERLFDLDGWSAHARALLGRLERLTPSTEHLAEGFVLSASVLRHFQSDPLLPAELLPRSWPGPALRARYDDWDRRYRTALATWHRGAAAAERARSPQTR